MVFAVLLQRLECLCCWKRTVDILHRQRPVVIAILEDSKLFNVCVLPTFPDQDFKCSVRELDKEKKWPRKREQLKLA